MIYVSIKTIFALFAGLLLIFSLQTGCKSKTKEKSPDKLIEIYTKERENAPKPKQYTKEEEDRRERQVAIADECLQKFNSCVEKCSTANCENTCSNALSLCEKDLPPDLKAIK